MHTGMHDINDHQQLQIDINKSKNWCLMFSPMQCKAMSLGRFRILPVYNVTLLPKYCENWMHQPWKRCRNNDWQCIWYLRLMELWQWLEVLYVSQVGFIFDVSNIEYCVIKRNLKLCCGKSVVSHNTTYCCVVTAFICRLAVVCHRSSETTIHRPVLG